MKKHNPKNNAKISDFFASKSSTGPSTSDADKRRRLSSGSDPENPKVLNNVSNVEHSPFRALKKYKTSDTTPINTVTVEESTPEKPLKPTRSGSTKKSPILVGSAKKRKATTTTPKKLFERSPLKFSSSTIDNFVIKSPPCGANANQTTPTKPSTSGNIGYTAIQASIVKYLSPSKSERDSPPINKLGSGVSFSDLGDDFFDDFVTTDVSPTLDLGQGQFCRILQVQRASAARVTLTLKSTDGSAICTLDGFWAATQMNTGDMVFVKASRQEDKGDWSVTNQSGWIVYEPDQLVACTTVAAGVFCPRRMVISERFARFEGPNRTMTIGVLVHQLFQIALKEKLTNEGQVQGVVRALLASESTLRRCYETEMSLDELESEMFAFVPKIVDFLSHHLDLSNPALPASDDVWVGKIDHVIDIEDNYWCREWGLKGKIDLTCRTIDDRVMPLEVKTGRATVSIEHRAQLLLYMMMMNKFGYNASSGLLLYLREGVLKEIPMDDNARRDILLLRNELVYHLHKSVDPKHVTQPKLPEPIDQFGCPRCSYNSICCTFLKYENKDVSNFKYLSKVYKSVTGHLSEAHVNYFTHWCYLNALEEENRTGFKDLREIYTLEPKEREKNGKSIVNLEIVEVGPDCNGLREHVFAKPRQDGEPVNFFQYGVVETHYVIVSVDARPAIASGFVTSVGVDRITVALDRDIKSRYTDQLFHVDNYESSSRAFNLTSLALLLEDTPRASELRSVIIDKAPPTFATKLPSVIARKGAPILKRLNRVQQRAVLKALCAEKYMLIIGMPGTGKTATIVALVQLLVALDRSVLITSHTHSAVDNICLRLLNCGGVNFMRLGAIGKVNDKLHKYSEHTLTKNCKTVTEIEKVYNEFNVFAVTCLGSNHSLLTRRVFDVCIVDESTQVVQSSIVRPLYSAKTFILIGDPDQLRPLVKSKEAVQNGMTESLFVRLNSSESVALNLNYRMNKTITHLANILTYKGLLEPANDSVANSTIKLGPIEPRPPSWALRALDTDLENAVQFIDTGPIWNRVGVASSFDSTGSSQSATGLNYVNKYEAAIAVTLVNCLIKGGVLESEIGVISTYRDQAAHLSSLLSKTSVQVSTIDKFQGQDKEVIIFSCSRSKDVSQNTDSARADLLEDRARLTVAMTRAKHKLIIVGDMATLRKYSTFAVILEGFDRSHFIEIKDDTWSELAQEFTFC